uniref:Uncharacterized protein n=1 Tax=Octopus bimaculoides TaxID=37653 RepID=A0A0L8I4H6_OCTBM
MHDAFVMSYMLLNHTLLLLMAMVFMIISRHIFSTFNKRSRVKNISLCIQLQQTPFNKFISVIALERL